jgi:hypothetical protein
VNVTLSLGVPALGTSVGVVHAKVPGTENVPPVSVDKESIWPEVIALAVGHAVTVGVALFTVTVTGPATVL